ncbi:hypothetical protein L6R52_13445 [Myxococcota bacterium]|nr:hypothetical protein [Myxococcota bacterium]
MPLSLVPLVFVAVATPTSSELDAIPDALVELEDRARVDQLLVEPFVSIDRVLALEDELDARATQLAPPSRARAIVLSFSLETSARSTWDGQTRGLTVLASLSIAFDALLEPSVDLRPAPGPERERVERCSSLLARASPSTEIDERRSAARATALGCAGGSRWLL